MSLFPSSCFTYSSNFLQRSHIPFLSGGGGQCFLGERAPWRWPGPTDLRQSRLGKPPCGKQYGLKFRGRVPKNDMGTADGEEEVVFFPSTKDTYAEADFSPKGLSCAGGRG